MVEVKGSKQAFLQAGDAQRIDGSPSGNLQPRGVGGGAGRGSLEARSSAEALPALPDPRLLNFRSRSQGIRLLHSKAWCLEKACPSFLAAARLGSVRGFGAMRGIKAVPWTDPVLGDRKDSRSQGIYCEPIAGSLRQLREGRDLLRPRSCPLSQAPGAHVRRVWRKRGWSLTTVLIGCPDSPSRQKTVESWSQEQPWRASGPLPARGRDIQGHVDSVSEPSQGNRSLPVYV
ncbi:uncharacterized protein [Manis javanica]|uniref:uncharacterized protein n=1 Tax=Manis javanica TaxID=9974 RepID=UPI003C6CF8D8